jgi:hypothetical protein
LKDFQRDETRGNIESKLNAAEDVRRRQHVRFGTRRQYTSSESLFQRQIYNSKFPNTKFEIKTFEL